MTFFVGYINNVVIKFPIHYVSHMGIAGHIMAINSEIFHLFIQAHSICMH
jgi:hypothetical protein